MQAGMDRSGIGEAEFWTQGLDRGFFTRMYKRAAQIGILAALISLGFDQKEVTLGLLAGLGVGLFSTWTVEVTVRLLFKGGGFAGTKLAVAAFAKMPLLLAALVPIAWACMNDVMNAFAVVGGLVLVHATMLVMVIGTALSAGDGNERRG